MGKPGLLAAPSSRGRCGPGEADSSPGLALVQDLAKLRAGATPFCSLTFQNAPTGWLGLRPFGAGILSCSPVRWRSGVENVTSLSLFGVSQAAGSGARIKNRAGFAAPIPEGKRGTLERAGELA